MIYLISMLAAASIYLIVTGYLTYERRIKLDLPKYNQTPDDRFNWLFDGLKRATGVVNRSFIQSPYVTSLQHNAEFLRLPFGGMELLMIKEICMIALGVVVAVLVAPLYGIIAGFVGFVLPDFFINNKIRAKKEAISEIFPEIIDLLDLCIGAGLDFLAATRWIIDKSKPNPFNEQLEIVLNEIQVGKSRTEAVRAMAARVGLADLNSFARTIIQAERMGISIEEALRNLSEDTRQSRFQRGERFAIKASLKILIPLMFFILPVILIVVAGPVIIQFTEGGIFGAGGGVMGP